MKKSGFRKVILQAIAQLGFCPTPQTLLANEKQDEE
jgi:hypothetical protein